MKKEELLSEINRRIFYAIYGEFNNLSNPLSLKPLSQISDEDAIECGFETCNNENDSNYGMSPSRCFLDELQYCGMTYISHEIDYLRSKGYALPYLGLSVEEMIEAGWIKLIIT